LLVKLGEPWQVRGDEVEAFYTIEALILHCLTS
jgi:hypothetical protein